MPKKNRRPQARIVAHAWLIGELTDGRPSTSFTPKERALHQAIVSLHDLLTARGWEVGLGGWVLDSICWYWEESSADEDDLYCGVPDDAPDRAGRTQIGVYYDCAQEPPRHAVVTYVGDPDTDESGTPVPFEDLPARLAAIEAVRFTPLQVL